jgi:hypothetical protein
VLSGWIAVCAEHVERLETVRARASARGFETDEDSLRFSDEYNPADADMVDDLDRPREAAWPWPRTSIAAAR